MNQPLEPGQFFTVARVHDGEALRDAPFRLYQARKVEGETLHAAALCDESGPYLRQEPAVVDLRHCEVVALPKNLVLTLLGGPSDVRRGVGSARPAVATAFLWRVGGEGEGDEQGADLSSIVQEIMGRIFEDLAQPEDFGETDETEGINLPPQVEADILDALIGTFDGGDCWETDEGEGGPSDE